MGKLILVPTPIGNLGDITKRAIDVLDASDVVYCEDTRVTSKLLSVLSIKKPLMRMDENSISEHVQKIVDDCFSGKVVCYCTDAGMPGISDPGSRIVSACRKADIEVEVLPGANAALIALVLSGFDINHFFFEGFLPKKNGDLDKALCKMLKFDCPSVIYESPKRIVKTLSRIDELASKRRVCVCRELTKMHEEVLIGTPKEVLSNLVAKGEFAVVIDGVSEEEKSQKHLESLKKANEFAKKQFGRGAKPQEIRDDLIEFFGCSKNEAKSVVYSLKLSKDFELK